MNWKTSETLYTVQLQKTTVESSSTVSYEDNFEYSERSTPRLSSCASHYDYVHSTSTDAFQRYVQNLSINGRGCKVCYYFFIFIIISDLSQRSIGGETPPQSPGMYVHPSFRTKKSATSMETHWEEDSSMFGKHIHSRYLSALMTVPFSGMGNEFRFI